MTVNIYDDLNALEATLRKTEAYANVQDALEVLHSDEEATKAFMAFRELQVNFQEKQMRGEELTEEDLAHAESITQAAQENPKIITLLESEKKLSETLDEINRVLMKSIQDLYEKY